MISNLFDKNTMRILSYFLISPGSRYSRKELKENTKMNNVPLDQTIARLKTLKIIEEKKKLYSLNLQNEEFKIILEQLQQEYKRFSVPYEIFNILIDISDRISRVKQVKEAFLFGSYAKLIYSEKSDIDIAIIFYNEIKNKNKLEKKINKELMKISKKSKTQIEVHYFSDADMKAKDPLIKDILKNNKKII